MSEYVVDLKDLTQDGISLSGNFVPGEIDFTGNDFRQSGPLVWTAHVVRAGQEIRIAGQLEGAVEWSCSRCLEPAQCGVSRTFDLFFRQQEEKMFDEDDEIELSEEDMRTSFFAGTQLAIGDIVREQVLLALPMKVLCRVDCKGLCPVCGTNLNINSCSCPAERFSPHMDQLLDIKRKLEERSS
jgi:uncharacterized protein